MPFRASESSVFVQTLLERPLPLSLPCVAGASFRSGVGGSALSLDFCSSLMASTIPVAAAAPTILQEPTFAVTLHAKASHPAGADLEGGHRVATKEHLKDQVVVSSWPMSVAYQLKARATRDDRSVSAEIRRDINSHLQRNGSTSQAGR
jgi:hypothetical protein